MDPEQPDWPPRYPTGGNGIQGPPHQYSPGPVTVTGRAPRINDSTWLWSLGWGLVALVTIAAINVAREPDQSMAFSSGQAMPAGLIPAVVVALLATNTSRQWPWWVIGAAVLSSASALYFAISVVSAIASDQRAQESGEADYVLVAPELAGPWELRHGRAVEARREAMLQRFEQAPEGMGTAEVVIAEYRRAVGAGRLGYVGFNPAGEFQDELRAVPERVLEDVMRGQELGEVEYHDSGPLGGLLACSTEVPDLPGAAACGWVDASTLATIVLIVPELTGGEAAELTREFREHVTER